MKLTWTAKALSDLERLQEFLWTVQALATAPTRLLDYPRIGEALGEFAPREVRRILVGGYEFAMSLRTTRSLCCAFGIRAKSGSVGAAKTAKKAGSTGGDGSLPDNEGWPKKSGLTRHGWR